jgi:hypothetical protein
MSALLKHLAELVGLKALDRLADWIVDKLGVLLQRIRDWFARPAAATV